ncbi:MAG: SusC/RagA family TonB-linked outer membrane protein [Tannerella sp.]|nr:SusC/RagA family TonB-linked outer membrane protein [Tannerella sp.]
MAKVKKNFRKIKCHILWYSIFYVFFSLPIFAQQNGTKIEGKVFDARTGEAIIGASVLLKEENTGSVTDVDGAFTVTVKSLPVGLTVSFIGYQSEDVDIYEYTEPLVIRLNEDRILLNEVVVIGYGTQKRKEFTGSAANISGEAIRDLPVQSFEQAISGRAAGVKISLPNGILNNPPVIRVRGVNSISLSSYPLIVIDGIPVSTGDISTNTNVPNNPLGDLNPSDIESIDILKDAASTSIYGSRAAAGVLLITTKKGKTGKPRTTYDGWVGVTGTTRLPKVLNALQYIEIKNESVLNAKILSGNQDNDKVSSALFFPGYNADGSLIETDWNDYVYRKGISHNHAVNISGGSGSTNYYFSTNYTKQQGILKGNDFERKGVRFNIDHRVNDWLKIVGTASYNLSETESYNSGSLPNSAQLIIGAARLAFASPPNVSPYNEDGSYNLSSTGYLGAGSNLVSSNLSNPLALFAYSSNTSANDRFIGNITTNIRLFKLLDYTVVYGIDRLKGENLTYYGPQLGSNGFGVGGSTTNVSVLRDNRTFTNTLGLDRRYGKHHISALLGNDIQQDKTYTWGAYATKASDDFFEYYQGGWTTVTSSNNFRGERTFLSYFARLSYDFNDKYYVTANLRRDGNSALAKGKKYGNFGGISAGWTILKENFLRSSALANIFDDAKLNVSWGRVGNGNLSNDYGSYSLYAASLYGNVPTWSLSQVGNSDLTWETSDQTNIGLTVDALKNRLSVELAWFNNDVNGLILNTPQSPSKGIPGNSILTNVGSMYNRGIELGINVAAIQRKDFSWNALFNFSSIRNKVTALAGNNEDILGYTHTSANSNNITRAGYSIASLYGAKTDGVNPENGRRIFINAKGEKVQYSAAVPPGESNWTYLDGTTAPAISVADYYVLGNTLPKWFGGFANNLRYRNFDLNLNFSYSGGNYIYNGTRGTLTYQTTYNNHTGILERWTTPGQVTDIPRLVYNDLNSSGGSFPVSANVEKADFLRLDNAVLGYKLPARIASAVSLSAVRFYVQASNAFLITGYTGTDPELSSNGNSNTSPGVERNSVGRGRTFTFGLNVTF